MKNKSILTASLPYYLIACAIAWPIFLNMSKFQDLMKPIGVPGINPFLIIMWGPGIGALFGYYIFRNKIERKISICGKKVLQSLVFFLAPWLIFFLLHLAFPFSEQYKPAKFLLIIPISFVFTLGEELGWRGYLQDVLRPISNICRWFIVGLMWELWHIRFLWISDDLSQGLLRTLPLLAGSIILSYLLGYATERSKSLLVPVTLHLWANFLIESPHWVTFLSAGLSAILWFYLLYKWPVKS
jgi:uncharacterized protein